MSHTRDDQPEQQRHYTQLPRTALAAMPGRLGRWTRRLAATSSCVLLGLFSCTVPAQESFTVKMLTAPFGTNVHSKYAAFGQALGREHGWLRFEALETPGWVYNTTEMANKPELRKDTLAAVSPGALFAAAKGMRPWRNPTEVEGWKALWVYYVLTGYFVTTSADIDTVEELAASRIGLGRATQTHWSVFPRLFLEHAYGYKLNRADSLGPSEAMRAMLDGTVDAAAISDSFTADFQQRSAPGAMMELESSGRPFTYISHADHAMIDKLNHTLGSSFLKMTIPAGAMPGLTSPMETYGDPAVVYAHEEFPEEAAYELVKFMIGHWQELEKHHSLWGLTTPATWVVGQTARTLHPGAVRAYREAGVNIREE